MIQQKITRVNNSLEPLKYQLGDSVNETEESELAQLPESLVNALNQLHEFIKHQLIVKKEIELESAIKNAETPIKNKLISALNTRPRFTKPSYFESAFFDNIHFFKPELKETIAELSEEECINIIKELSKQQIALNFKVTPQTENIFIQSVIDFQNNIIIKEQTAAHKLIKQISAIDPEKESEAIFAQVKAAFLDRLAVYCTKIISAEDVHFGDDGSINAIVHAENGSFKVHTIYARTVGIFKNYISEY